MAPYGFHAESKAAFESKGQQVHFVPKVEPLFGLDCQESTRGLVPFFLALLTSFFDWVPTRVPRRLGSVNERFERVFAR